MGLTCKQLAHAWRIPVSKTTQAAKPTFRKLAQALSLYPRETMETIVEAMQQMARESAEKNSLSSICAGELSPHELYLRESMLTGRIDRERIHPRPQTPKRQNAETPKAQEFEGT